MNNETTLHLRAEIAKIKDKIAENQVLSEDPELGELAVSENEKLKEQVKSLESTIDTIENGYTENDIVSDDEDVKDAIVEIRAAAGGDESGLFAAELYKMYIRYAESQGWKYSQLNISEGGIGNIKNVMFEIIGKKDNPAYPLLQYESGVHRVQRVPATESSGRVHTSTATVAVLPKINPKQIDIKNEDLQIDVFRSSGPGGQSVNTTDSAVRITHIPTNVTVSMQDEKSQHKNREKALAVLSSRLYTIMKQQEKEKLDDIRSEQIGSGERSEKIRTYNFPQSRITDHRIGESWHNIDAIMAGEINDIVRALHEKLGSSGDKTANKEVETKE